MFFDLDGTLTDSIPPAVDAIQKMISELGFPQKTRQEIGQHVGFGEVPLVSGSIGSQDQKVIEQAMESYFRHYTGELKNIPLLPHVKEMLEHFKQVTKVIISNKRDLFIREILRHQQIDQYFSEVLGGDTSPCLKPDPCMILPLLEKYRTPQNQAIFIGDMTVDIETGRNAGIHTCAVTHGFDSRSKLLAAKPDFVIDNFSELETLIKGV